MTEPTTLIDQALAVVDAHPPKTMADSIPLSPEQAMVWLLYTAARDRDKSYGSEEEVRKAVANARAARIPEHEIGAALAAVSEL